MNSLVRIFQVLVMWQFSTLVIAGVSTGTGFFISSSGYIATNFHVIEGGANVKVRDHTGAVSDAVVVLRDSNNDLAVLKINGTKHLPMPIRSSSQAKKGMDVFTLGFPNVTIQGRESKVTQGIVSSLSGLRGEPNSFQISVPIQPGNSGGPLIDMSGAVIGLTTAKLSAHAMLQRGSQLPENVNYAVKSNYLLELLATDSNIGRETVSAGNEKELPLTKLLERVERSVVFIIVNTNEADNKESGGLPGKQAGKEAKYVADAKAAEFFASGLAAVKKGDLSAALRLFGDAATLGHAKAQLVLGEAYAYGGLGLSKDESEAGKWFRKAAEQGNADAQGVLGWMYRDGRHGLSKDDSEAVKWFRKAAEQGNANAQADLGVMYEAGRGGLSKDDIEAAKWYSKAAEQGNAAAQNNLGVMYASGRGGLSKDDTESAKWFRKAAEQGDTNAQNSLGVMYVFGLGGLQKDDAEAVKWFRKAAEQGNANAQNSLGRMYAAGRGGLSKDDAEAVKWFRKAAEQGNSKAMEQLKKYGLQ